MEKFCEFDIIDAMDEMECQEATKNNFVWLGWIGYYLRKDIKIHCKDKKYENNSYCIFVWQD